MALPDPEDELIALARKRTGTHPARKPCTARDLSVAHKGLGFDVPRLYARILSEVANGGFGPGDGFVGVSPDGFRDPQRNACLVERYLEDRDPTLDTWRIPAGLLPVCTLGRRHTGEEVVAYIDALSENGLVAIDNPTQDRFEFSEAAPDFATWFRRWLDGADTMKSVDTVVGYRDGINPFTKLPQRYPIVEPVGRRLDFSDRE